MRAARALIAVASAVVAFLLSGAQLARLGHLALVQHARCAEHGELVHASEHTAHERPAAAGRNEHAKEQPGVRRAKARVDAATGCAPGHDHCDAAWLAQGFAVARAPALETSLLDAYVLPWSMRPLAGSAAIDLLLLAPKSSPPA